MQLVTLSPYNPMELSLKKQNRTALLLFVTDNQ